MNTVADWKTYARQVLSAVDPQFAESPVYLLSLAEAAAAFDGGEPMLDIDGLGGASFAAALRGVLDSRREWRGYGFACAVDPFLGVVEASAVVLHEYAHHLDQHDQHDHWRTHERCRPSLGGVTIEPVPLAFGDAAPPSWRHHGPTWIRLCLHLAERVVAARQWTYLDAICDPRTYALSSAREYRAALGDEPARLAGLSMLDVARTLPPASFVEFGSADIVRAGNETRAARAAA